MFTLAVPPDFDLPRAVCSYGFFMLAPNRWDAATGTLHTVLRGKDDQPIHASIRQRDGRLRIEAGESITRDDAAIVRRQVGRMLRVDDDLSAFHRVHRPAKRAGFGRLFRSATLFEDIVKTMTCCNVAWSSTVRMNELLCQHHGGGGFPTPAQLAAVPPARLKQTCRVGYRAQRIIRLARDVSEGRLNLAALEEAHHSTSELFDALRGIYGVGPYAANNLLMLLGRYDRLAIDSETYRHFRQRHDVPTPRDSAGLRRLHARIEKHYAAFAPFQFLAYWFELWGAYEDRLGDARKWQGNPIA
jgi:3-methyladenine DNA glycosylase/8-oxoguanine DNA glycosylase